MSFDIKYDRNGSPIKSEQVPQMAPVESVEPVQASSDLPESSDDSMNESIQAVEQNLHQEAQIQPSTPVVETKYETNLRALREKTLKMEQERNDALLRLQQFEAQRMQAQSSVSTPPQESEPEDYLNFSDDELVEGKHLNKAMKNIQAKIKAQEQQLKMQQQDSINYATEVRLKSQFNDFEKVVTEENLKLLNIMHPEVSVTIRQSTGDLYSKSVSAYHMIKNLGVYQEDTYEQDREVIKKNSAKPRPLVSVSPQQGDSALSRANAFANGLTEDLKKQLYQDMMKHRHN